MATPNPYLGVDNPYLTANVDRAQGDLVRNYNLTAQPAFNSAMVRSGSFGNEGVNQMNQNAQLNLQNALGNVSTQMRGQDYQNQQQLFMQQQGMDTAANQFDRQFDRSGEQWNLGFDRSVFNDSFAQNQQQLQTGIGLLGTLAGYNANDQQSATTQQNTPLNYWQQFSQGANSLGQGYGTSTGTTGTSSNPLVQAIGGAQLGNSAMNWWNTQGSSASAPASSNTGGWATSPSWDAWATGTGGMGG